MGYTHERSQHTRCRGMKIQIPFYSIPILPSHFPPAKNSTHQSRINQVTLTPVRPPYLVELTIPQTAASPALLHKCVEYPGFPATGSIDHGHAAAATCANGTVLVPRGKRKGDRLAGMACLALSRGCWLLVLFIAVCICVVWIRDGAGESMRVEIGGGVGGFSLPSLCGDDLFLVTGSVVICCYWYCSNSDSESRVWLGRHEGWLCLGTCRRGAGGSCLVG